MFRTIEDPFLSDVQFLFFFLLNPFCVSIQIAFSFFLSKLELMMQRWSTLCRYVTKIIERLVDKTGPQKVTKRICPAFKAKKKISLPSQVSRATSTVYLLALSFFFFSKDKLLPFQIPRTVLPLHIYDAFIQSIWQSCSGNVTTCYSKKAAPWSDLHFPGNFLGSL